MFPKGDCCFYTSGCCRCGFMMSKGPLQGFQCKVIWASCTYVTMEQYHIASCTSLAEDHTICVSGDDWMRTLATCSHINDTTRSYFVHVHCLERVIVFTKYLILDGPIMWRVHTQHQGPLQSGHRDVLSCPVLHGNSRD